MLMKRQKIKGNSSNLICIRKKSKATVYTEHGYLKNKNRRMSRS